MLKGANWGMDEGMLRCDRQRFRGPAADGKRHELHHPPQLPGQRLQGGFFDLCDQYGLLVWEEFGINHNTTPDDLGVYFENATDRLRRGGITRAWPSGARPTRAARRNPSSRPCPGWWNNWTARGSISSIRPSSRRPGATARTKPYCPLFYFQLARGFRRRNRLARRPHGGKHAAHDAAREALADQSAWATARLGRCRGAAANCAA